jgi:D-proline reductase (dithiol) PrdB
MFEGGWADTSEAEADPNVLLPADRFIELRERRFFAELHGVAYSFPGSNPNTPLWHQAGKRLGEAMRQEQVDLVLFFPSGLECNQAVCLLAGEVERLGISTLVVVTVKEVALEIRPPRAVFLNFPFGTIFGRAHSIPLQRAICEDLLRAIKSMDHPGRLLELPYRWSPEHPG